MATYYLDENGKLTTQKKKKNGTTYVMDKDGKITEERTWFQKGEFADGYQFGDVTKTILGSAGDLLEDAGAGILGMGEKTLDFLMYAAPLVAQGEYYQNGGAFQKPEIQQRNQEIFDSMKTSNAEFIEKDLYNEEKIAKSVISAPIKNVTGFDIEDASVFGAKSDSLAQSAGQLGATVGLQMVGVPWWLTTGATSFGSEAESALNQGASYEEAGLSATITAGAEILTEKMFGAISFGGKAVDDVTIKPLTEKISNKVVKKLVDFGVDAGGEGFEEVVSSVISNLGTSLYKEENVSEILFSEEALDEYIESFIGGAVLGGGSNIIQSVSNNTVSNNINEVTFTENEQKVIDKEVEDRIKEREDAGETLTDKDMSAIEDQVKKELEKGYISTDKIESVLGGGTYESYKAVTEQESALKKEIETLENLPKEQITVKQSERLAEARQQLNELDLDTTKNQLSTEVSELAKADRLGESYNEVARRSQEFEADLTKYDKKQAAVVKNAMDSGILNNTNKTHDFVDMIARLSAEKGVSFDFTNNEKLKESGFVLEGKTINGFVSDGKVSLNIDSAKSLNSVVGHEITHVLEGSPELYKGLQSVLFELAKTRGEYDTRLQDITKLYEGVEGANIEAELTADLVGDYLFTDSDFINKLSVEKPNIFKRIYEEIKYLYKVATAGSKEAKQLEKVKRAFEKAYRGNSKTSGGATKYHISSTFSEEIDKTLNNEMPKSSQVKARDYTPEILVENGVKDLPMLITQKHVKSTIYTEEEAKNLGLPTGKGDNYHGLGKELLMKSIDNMDNPSEIYKQDDDHFLIITELQNSKGDNIIIPVKIDGRGTYNDVYIEENQILSAYGKGNLQAYLDRNNFELIYKKNGTALNEGVQYPNISDSVEDTIPQNESDVNGELKLAVDSDGRQLSEKQKEFFKDSKNRDENGHLKVMYHGTEKGGFTEFVGRFSDDGKSFFFVDNPEVAKGYSGTHEEFAPVSYKTADDLNRFFKEINAADYTAAEENGKFILYDEGDEVATSDTADGLYEEFRDWTGLGYGSANYKVYVNVVNPLVVDAKGENWDSLDMADYDYDQETVDVHDFYVEQTGWDLENDKPIFHVEAETSENTYDEDMSEEDIYNHFGRSFAEDLVERAKDDFEGYQIWKTRRINKDVTKNLPMKTRDFAEYAYERGYDGVIFKNIVDNGLYASGKERFTPATVVVAFDSSQIKSVENTEPTSNPDIRYSLSEDSQGRNLSGEQKSYFKDSKIVDGNGSLKVMYHGTADDFTVFNPFLKGGKNGTAEGYGIYFTDNVEVSNAYGGNVMSGYLNVTHPATSDKKTIKKAELIKLIKATTEVEAKRFVDDGDYDNINDALKDTWISDYVYTYDIPISEAYREVADSILSMNHSDMDIIQEVMGGNGVRDYESAYEFYDILKNTLGIDGFVTNWEDSNTGKSSQIVVAFDSNQFKNVDNLNPTSDADIRKSLSTESGHPVQRGNYNVYGKDIALKKDVAPVQEVVAENTTTTQDEFAPMTEAQANERDEQQYENFYSLEENEPWESDEPWENFAPTTYTASVDSPFDEKDIKAVGNRKVKAYMYENPEVKPFFQEEAQNMLYDLKNSVKGERYYDDNLHYQTGGDMGWSGTSRMTSPEIAYLLDSFKYTYAEIEKGLNAIIEDHGAENNAVSKRIEFLIDERLREGYKHFLYGDEIPPNQGYINLLTEKQITEYNDEAFNRWASTLTDADVQDIAPLPETVEAPKEPETAKVQQTAQPKTTEAAPLYDAQPKKGVTEGQLSMFEETEAPKKVTRSALHSNIVENIKNYFAEKGFDFDSVLRKAKDLSTFKTVDNTPQRVMEKALGYKEGQALSDLTVNQVAKNETEGIKWLNSFTDRKNGLLAQISKQYGIKPGSKASAAAQMYAEGFYVDENNDIVAYGDAELAKDFPNRRVQENIKGLAKDGRIRQIYDETLKMINESRTRNAYPEIPRLDNYFLHFRAMDDTFSRLGLPFNPNDIRAKDLPTDLNGVTADLKPGQPYFASAKHRTGKRTSFDLLGGLERYLSSAKNQIYHIDDIQTLRALRNYIADTYGQAHGLEGLDTLTEEEAQDRIKEVYDSHLSTFAKFLNEEANVLAGKTSLIDRGLEGVIGRRGITFLDTVNRQVGANMVGFNISSSLTNFISVAQAFAKSNKAAFVKAFAQTASNKIGSIVGRNDGFTEQSPVMIRRKGAESFYRTPWQKAGDAGYFLMSAVDNISTELIARTKYNELVSKGMDAQKAHYETDKWVSRLMGDRSLGQQPQIYNSKMLGILTKFQLEVRNQLDSQFYDTIQEAKVSNEEVQNRLTRNAKTAAKVTSTFFQLAVAQHLFGKAFESVAGYNPAFDIISVLIKALGFDDDDESEDTVLDNVEQGFLELLGDLPYTSIFTGGRIPIESALPIEQFVTGKDDYGNEKSRWETLGEAAPYYVLPAGYNQIKKTSQGLGMFDDDLPIAGSYTDSGNLRFTVEDTLQNRVQAGVFGQWASDEARDYFDNERNPLKEKQIQELVDLDLPIREYWDYREGLAEQKTLEDKFDYIAGLDVSVEQKNIMINNVVDRKEAVDMSNYDDFADYEEFDFYTKNTEKYNFLEENGVSYKDYISSEDAKKEYDSAYSWYKNNPEKVTVSKAITDNVIEYRRYTSELNDIRADKDEDGDSISGSAKEKKAAYINQLDLDYGQKIILFRTYYDSQEDKSTYNGEIVEYLNGRDDISYEEMVTILKELDMKVYSDGRVEW